MTLSFKKKIMIWVLLLNLLGTTNAFAQKHHPDEHHHHQSSVTSPFNEKKERQSVHCVLKGHSHKGYCPHSKINRDQAASFKLTVDCGGKAKGSNASITFCSNDFAGLNLLLYTPSFFPSKLVFSNLPTRNYYIDLLDPPPKVL